MLNRDQIAHEYVLNGVAKTVYSAFQLADAMIVEAEKRTNKERPAVLGGDWISVDDRLPEDRQEVLIYCIESKTIKTSMYRREFNDFRNTFEVSHWQPLPARPFFKK